MDPVTTAPFPFLVEHSIYLPWAIKDDQAIASPLEDFCRDFDEHTLIQLEAAMPWLRDAWDEACPSEDDYDEDEMAAGIFRAVGQGRADGWLVQVKVPTPPRDSWGSAWVIWAYGPTVQHAIASALERAKGLRAAKGRS